MGRSMTQHLFHHHTPKCCDGGKNGRTSERSGHLSGLWVVLSVLWLSSLHASVTEPVGLHLQPVAAHCWSLSTGPLFLWLQVRCEVHKYAPVLTLAACTRALHNGCTVQQVWPPAGLLVISVACRAGRR